MNDNIDDLISRIGSVLANPARLHEYTLVVTPEVHRKISQCLTEERGVLYFCGIRVAILSEASMKTFFTAPFTTPSNAFLVHNGHVITQSSTYNFESGKLFFHPAEDNAKDNPAEPENTAIEDFLNSIPTKKETDHAPE